MSKSESIKIGINDEVIELTGAEKEKFLVQQKADKAEQEKIEAEQLLRQKTRQDAIKKLAEVAGLNAEELKSIL